MDINTADDYFSKKITELIEEKHPECEFIDYKEHWQKSTAELFKDIFSFTNTVHDKDCYLIYGVRDSNKEVIGIEDDENRRDQKDILDTMTHSLKIAGDMIPPIDVVTVRCINHDVDVLIVKNNNNVPVYLSELFNDTKGAYKPHSIHPGQIFTRVGTKNTDITGTANFNITEKLWRKHLGIGLPIMDRYFNVLKDYHNWTYEQDEEFNDNDYSFRYDIDPNFKISLSDTSEGRMNVEPYLIDFNDPTIWWSNVKLLYNNTNIYEDLGVYFNKTHEFMICPESYLSNQYNTRFNRLFFFVKGSLKYTLNKLVLNKTLNSHFVNHLDGQSEKSFLKDLLLRNIIIFNSESEKNDFLEIIKNKYKYDSDFSKDNLNEYINESTTRLSIINSLDDFQKKDLVTSYASSRIFKEFYLNKS